MPKIIISNVRAEYAETVLAGMGGLPPGTCWRHAWYASDGDVLLTPDVVAPAFLRYVGGTVGFDADSIRVISTGRIVSDEVLLSPDIVDQLRTIVSDPADWTVMPSFSTPGVVELAAVLGIAPNAGHRFVAERGIDLLNRKSHFRQLAAGVGLPIPAGAIVRSPDALGRAVERLLSDTGTVIVKQDSAGGGHGNIIVTAHDTGPLPGARETLPLPPDIDALARDLWHRLIDARHPSLVVESYHPAAHMFYFEYHIGSDATIELLDSGTVLLRESTDPAAARLVWVGLEIPADLPPFSMTSAATQAAQFIRAAAAVGYRGYLNIDAILTPDGALYFNEVNARWGGGLVYHFIGERLLGPRYADRRIVSSLLDITPAPLEELLTVLHDTGLAYDADAQEGVLLLACEPTLSGGAEFVVVARSREGVRAAEKALRAATGD